MKTWKIPVVYQMMGVVEVVADTLSEAMKLAKDDDGDIPLPDNASYLEDSWELASDDEQSIRECYNNNQEDACGESLIKPCPFCGGTPALERIPLWSTHKNGSTHGYYGCYEYVIKCRNIDCCCGIVLPKNNTVYNPDEVARKNAIDAWNRRAE